MTRLPDSAAAAGLTIKPDEMRQLLPLSDSPLDNCRVNVYCVDVFYEDALTT